MRKLCGTTLVLAFVGFGQTAHAGEVTRVATAFEDENRFDLHFGVAYEFNFKQAAILREWNTGLATDDENRLVKDLIYQRQRHTVTPSLELGLWHDLALYTTLPIIVQDQSTYGFDQRADDCVFGEDDQFPNVNCVNKRNSTTVRDGILPANGFDATSSAPFNEFTGPGTEQIFKGPVRRGLDQLIVGIKFGILSQRKFSHMPNWIIAAEGRFAVGRAMTMSRNEETADPDGNKRVGRKIHELGLWTALSRRYRFLDPFFTAFWRQSLRASGSKFDDFGDLGAQDEVNPQSQAGVTFGTEIVPWERKAKSQKVSLFFQGSATLHYGGRAYSEIWELLADSPALVGDVSPAAGGTCDRAAAMAYAAANPGDPDYVEAGGECQRFNGITAVQDYASFGLNAALNFHMGPYARLMIGTNLQTDTRHFLTFTDRGADLNGNSTVDPGTTEVNPLRRDVIDSVGRRYVIDDVLDVYAYLNFLLTF